MEKLKMAVIERTESGRKYISNIGLEKKISELLDISKRHHDLAVIRYQDIGNWLDRYERVATYKPNIYPQGSFVLGTVTKSLSDEEDYDLDFVIELEQPRENITPSELKELVGNAIKLYVRDNYTVSLQEEGKRCWTLDYSESAKFHMDVLPAIPATTTSYQSELTKYKRFNRSHTIGQTLKVASNLSKSAIAITDKQPNNNYVWLLSNPRGYAEWFEEMSSIGRDPIVIRAVASAPDYQSEKSPLQRVVQLLKRHRDIWIERRQTYYSQEDKPISIIITTLAAKAYRYDVRANETNILQALQVVVETMLKYIKDGDLVRNPVNEHENFADKWETHPQRKECFYKWHKQVEDDLNSLNSVLNKRYVSDDEIQAGLSRFF